MRTFRIKIVLDGVWDDEDHYYLDEVVKDAVVGIDDNVRGKVTSSKIGIDCSRPSWLGMWNNP